MVKVLFLTCCFLALLLPSQGQVNLYLFPPAEGQVIHWGPPHRGLRMGLSIMEGEFSFRYDLFFLYQGPKADIVINPKLEIGFFLTDAKDKYELFPSDRRIIQEPRPPLVLAGGRRPPFQGGSQIPRDKELLWGTYIVPRTRPVSYNLCSHRDEIPDLTWVELRNVIYTDSSDDHVFETERVRVPYCTKDLAGQESIRSQYLFLEKFLHKGGPVAFEMARDYVTDRSPDNIFRDLSASYLAQLKTPESRDLLYQLCLDPKDPKFEGFLYFFFETKDERGKEFFKAGARSKDEYVRGNVAYAIGAYHSVEHLALLKELVHDPSRSVRGQVMQTCKEFDREEAREILYQGLLDPDYNARADALQGLEQVGTKESLPYLLKFIETETANHVGHHRLAFEAAEKITGEKFERDLERLRTYMRENGL